MRNSICFPHFFNNDESTDILFITTLTANEISNVSGGMSDIVKYAALGCMVGLSFYLKQNFLLLEVGVIIYSLGFTAVYGEDKGYWDTFEKKLIHLNLVGGLLTGFSALCGQKLSPSVGSYLGAKK